MAADHISEAIALAGDDMRVCVCVCKTCVCKYTLTCIAWCVCVCVGAWMGTGCLVQSGGEVRRHGQGAHHPPHAADGRSDGHLQPHGPAVWSLRSLRSGKAPCKMFFGFYFFIFIYHPQFFSKLTKEIRKDSSLGHCCNSNSRNMSFIISFEVFLFL